MSLKKPKATWLKVFGIEKYSEGIIINIMQMFFLRSRVRHRSSDKFAFSRSLGRFFFSVEMTMTSQPLKFSLQTLIDFVLNSGVLQLFHFVPLPIIIYQLTIFLSREHPSVAGQRQQMYFLMYFPVSKEFPPNWQSYKAYLCTFLLL